MRTTLIAALLGMAGCATYQPPTVAPIATTAMDRACISAAGDRLAGVTGREASAGRIVSSSSAMGGFITDERMVELDSVSVGMPTTYVFYCARSNLGVISVRPISRGA